MSDHIPDVTKMIGWTPRTDAAKFWSNIGGWVTLASEFMELERELNAANERIKNLESALSTVENIDKVNAYQDLESANERIKRLEEAGDKLEYASVISEAGEDPNGFEKLLIAQLEWREAKEAKP